MVYLVEEGVEKPIGTTEVFLSSNEPLWITSFVIDYKFGVEQKIGAKVFEVHSSKQTLLGESVTLFCDIVKMTSKSNLTNNAGSVTIVGDNSYYPSPDNLVARVSATNLPNISNQSSIFFIIWRQCEFDYFVPVWQSSSNSNKNNPAWGNAKFSLTTLCNCDIERCIKVVVYHRLNHKSNNNDRQFIGSCVFPIKQILQSDTNRIELALEDKANKIVGMFVFENVYLEVYEQQQHQHQQQQQELSHVDTSATLANNTEEKLTITNADGNETLPTPPLSAVILTEATCSNNKDSDNSNIQYRHVIDPIAPPYEIINEFFGSNQEDVITSHPPSAPPLHSIPHLTRKLPFYNIQHESSFINYLMGGCEIKLTVAIDYTLSNKVPWNKASLHYIHDNSSNTNNNSSNINDIKILNQYQQSIISIGNILEHYDSDKKYPVYGFGAEIKGGPSDVTNHCFNLNPHGKEVDGVDGILQAYEKIMNDITFAGPTYLAQIINKVNDTITQDNCSQKCQQYTILLIITDGDIDDMYQTKKAIIRGSYLPLSIIIIGVGDNDFEKMIELDSDYGLLSIVDSEGQKVEAKRDIVQFVPFRKYENRSANELAAQVLEEVPRQLTSYMRDNNILPN